jgi:hypothetical protein
VEKDRYFVSLELGQGNDPTALAVLSRPYVGVGTPPNLRRPSCTLGHLEGFPIGTPYADIFKYVRKLLQNQLMHRSILAVDKTAVGSGVVQMLHEALEHRQVNCQLWRVVITAGQAVGHQDGVGYCVPKQELVGAIQVLLQNRRLRIPRGLAHADLLVSELQNFKLKVPTLHAEQSLEAWREGPHDDLVLAVALAAWYSEVSLPPLHEPPPEPRLYRPFRTW